MKKQNKKENKTLSENMSSELELITRDNYRNREVIKNDILIDEDKRPYLGSKRDPEDSEYWITNPQQLESYRAGLKFINLCGLAGADYNQGYSGYKQNFIMDGDKQIEEMHFLLKEMGLAHGYLSFQYAPIDYTYANNFPKLSVLYERKLPPLIELDESEYDIDSNIISLLSQLGPFDKEKTASIYEGDITIRIKRDIWGLQDFRYDEDVAKFANDIRKTEYVLAKHFERDVSEYLK